MKLKCLIVDDEYPARRELRHLLSAKEHFEVVGEAATVPEAWQLANAVNYTVVFIDIDMPETSGLELSRKLQQLEKPPLVIFVTAHEEYALQAFEADAIDYLLKPLDPRRLDKALAKVLNTSRLTPPAPIANQNREEEKTKSLGLIPVERQGKMILIEERNIVYIAASNDYTYIKTPKEKYLTRFTLKEMEQRLNPKSFYRCHRSYLVNIRKAREVIPLYNGTLVLVVDDSERSEIPVSRSRSKKLRLLLGM